MSTPATVAPDPGTSPNLTALAQLRAGTNPFTYSVVTAGTEAECIAFDVPEILDGQLADLRAIVAQYRDGRPPARVFPILGPTGSGKTHLLARLVTELNRDAEQAGAESIVIAAGRIPPNLNGIDYLYRLLVSHLLTPTGPGARTLSAVAARLSGRLLSQALRQLPPHKQVGLIPAGGMWEQLRLKLGSTDVTERRLAAVAELILQCDRPNPRAEDVRAACGAAGISVPVAVAVAGDYLERAESKDALGWVRRELYTRLIELTLLGDRAPFEELLVGDVENLPPHLAHPAPAGGEGEALPRVIDRWLLTAWLELLDEFKVPVVVVFDQLEDDIRRPTEPEAAVAARAFTQVLASIVNNVPDICILVFAANGPWNELILRAEQAAADRLSQPFSLPGRAAQRFIDMPDRIEPTVLERVIRRRIQAGFNDLDLTGLPPVFPFGDADVVGLQGKLTIREALRTLAKRYNQIVFGEIDAGKLRDRLTSLWNTAVAGVKKEFGSDGLYSAAKVPQVQAAIDSWLRLLHQEGITGFGAWHGVELLHVEFRRQYGYLNVIRTNGPDAPGIGVAAWLAENPAKPNDLRRRLEFFDDNPCPVRTLILLRRDGEAALVGASEKPYRDAVAAGRDVRVQKFDVKHAHALLALDRWRQAAGPEVEPLGDEGRKVYREFLKDQAAELVGWIDGWRSPSKGAR